MKLSRDHNIEIGAIPASIRAVLRLTTGHLWHTFDTPGTCKIDGMLLLVISQSNRPFNPFLHLAFKRSHTLPLTWTLTSPSISSQSQLPCWASNPVSGRILGIVGLSHLRTFGTMELENMGMHWHEFLFQPVLPTGSRSAKHHCKRCLSIYHNSSLPHSPVLPIITCETPTACSGFQDHINCDIQGMGQGIGFPCLQRCTCKDVWYPRLATQEHAIKVRCLWFHCNLGRFQAASCIQIFISDLGALHEFRLGSTPRICMLGKWFWGHEHLGHWEKLPWASSWVLLINHFNDCSTMTKPLKTMVLTETGWIGRWLASMRKSGTLFQQNDIRDMDNANACVYIYTHYIYICVCVRVYCCVFTYYHIH